MERSRTDYYRVLQVDPSANQLVIQAAYRVLAQIFHPDVSGDDTEMKKINAAWEILGDARRRRQYDIERAGRHPGANGHAPAAASAATAQPRTTHATPHRPTEHGATSSHARPAPDPATYTPPSSVRQSEDHAGPPLGEPFGPLLRFGRYEGWTLGQVTRVDRPYLEWLKRVPAGRALKEEIDAVLRTRRGPGAVDERRTYEANQAKVHTWTPGAPTKLR